MNGKVYIGKTILTMKQRWRNHLKDAKRGLRRYFAHALKKYGAAAFTIELLADGFTTPEELSAAEVSFIALYKSTDPKIGYNRSLGGDGWSKTETDRILQSERQKGTHCGPENPFYGKKHTEENRRRMSEAARGVKKDPAVVRRRADTLKRNGSNKGEKHHMWGKQHTAEQIEVFRQASTGSNNAMYGRRGPDAPSYGRKASPESIARMSAARRAYWSKKRNTPGQTSLW